MLQTHSPWCSAYNENAGWSVLSSIFAIWLGDLLPAISYWPISDTDLEEPSAKIGCSDRLCCQLHAFINKIIKIKSKVKWGNKKLSIVSQNTCTYCAVLGYFCSPVTITLTKGPFILNSMGNLISNKNIN